MRVALLFDTFYFHMLNSSAKFVDIENNNFLTLRL
jgi:hypothetical protein